MCTVTGPASAAEAPGMLETAAALLAGLDAAQMPAGAAAELLRDMEGADAVLAAGRGGLLAAGGAGGGYLGDGQRTVRSWLVHSLRVTPGQAASDSTPAACSSKLSITAFVADCASFGENK